MAKVKVKMLKTAVGPEGNYLSGKKYSMEEKLAKSFKKDDACEILEKEKEPAKKSTGSTKAGENGGEK